jgi:hypothetical protein
VEEVVNEILQFLVLQLDSGVVFNDWDQKTKMKLSRVDIRLEFAAHEEHLAVRRDLRELSNSCVVFRP